MRLNVSYVGYDGKSNTILYHAVPDRIRSNPNPDTLAQELTKLARRIKLVGENILGEHLHSVEMNESEAAIDIHVSKYIKLGSRKVDFRSFIGWVEVFGTEAGLATRASIPRAN